MIFWLRIVKGDESWFHHFEPETKRHSMEWRHLHSPSKKKAKAISCEGDGHSLLVCRGVDFGRIRGTWAKPSPLLVMSRHCTSSNVHCAINVWDETSSSCMTTLAPTPLASHRKQLQRWGGKLFHTPPIALLWHPPTTIFSDL